ncbi:hypothetical protein N7457_006882 [Penicillium paradoxum]|uniref:uncharacterized protein n=1 Tax=Penicillium paradoxum TaxID=176176 RepID=UPI0025497275|nr:uncharacterized protein N7457_006882 [Penicillium paradoxum]KAJ5779162.1 hypothetical protein N7457_006882 [Penicillium paradoxum]
MIPEIIPEAVLPAQLLRYLPTHRVLICLHCHYAIQPGAIVRHLKETHHLNRLRRRGFVDYASQFKLAPLDAIILPDETQFPVDVLPIHDGLACRFEGCNHLCITTKRMKAHWSTVHHLNASDNGIFWCSVPLQTLFRGNALRYFTNPALLASPSDSTDELMSAGEESPSTTITVPDIDGQQKASILSTRNYNISLNAESAELFDHYLNSTYKTLSCGPDTDSAFRVIVPQLATRFPFLLHGMLACSALHLASSHPDNRDYYMLQAIRHQDQALPAFHLATMHVDSSNCQAILSFAFFLVFYAFSSESEHEVLLLGDQNATPSSSNWISLLRNGCSMLCPVWSELTNGPLASFAALWKDDLDVTIKSDDPLLRSLLSVISNESVGCERQPENELHIYQDAAQKLAEAFEFARQCGSSLSIWDALNSWPMRVLPGYFDLLDRSHPGALLLLAQYAVLLKPLQKEWFLGGRVTKLIDEIGRRLQENCPLQVWQLFSELRRECFA